MDDRRVGHRQTPGHRRRMALVLALIIGAVAALPTHPPAPVAAAPAPPNPAPIISRDAPAFASSSLTEPARNANDADYGTRWRSVGTPAWLAYDLSAIPVARRTRVAVAWYNDPVTPDYDPTLINVNAYNLPSDYTLEANRAAGGELPSAGWTTLATVTGNRYHSRQHVVDLTGFNWIRMNVTSSFGSPDARDIALNLDVHDAGQGAQDNWFFFGDYLTGAALDHAPRGAGTFGQLINSCLPERFPIQESGGTSFLQSRDGARVLDTYLPLFQGQFVALSFGTTEASYFPPGDPFLPDAFYNNYATMVQAVLAVGKTPVIPTIPWARTNNAQENITNLNKKIYELYAAYPQIVRGPDLYTYFATNQGDIAADDLTPTNAGFTALRYQWVAAALGTVYQGNAAQFFPETGRCIRQPFLDFWQSHGALRLLGLPLTTERIETLEDGKAHPVQYFERARLEYHDEIGDPQYRILLGQLGRSLRPAEPPVPQQPGARYFPETGHNLDGGFRAFWQANGGLAQFGFPISEVFEERLEDGKTYRVQYFERARFEYHPENPPPDDILLGQFGRRIAGKSLRPIRPQCHRGYVTSCRPERLLGRPD